MARDILADLKMWLDHTQNKYARERITKAIAEIKRLRQENAILTAEHDALRAERDEVRRACKAWEANLAEQQEVDPADLQALIDAAWKDDRLTVKMSARDLWRMATDRRGREEE